MEISVICDYKLVCDFKPNRNDRRSLDRFAKKVIKNKKLIKFVVIFLALLLIVGGQAMTSILSLQAVPVANFGKIEVLGDTIMSAAKSIGKVVILACAAKEIIQTAINGNIKDIGTILIKYICIWASLFALPWIMDIVVEAFS